MLWVAFQIFKFFLFQNNSLLMNSLLKEKGRRRDYTKYRPKHAILEGTVKDPLEKFCQKFVIIKKNCGFSTETNCCEISEIFITLLS